MVSMCFTCWGQVIKSNSIVIDDAYQGWPPVKIYPSGHIDLEFVPFLLADAIVMDKESFYTLTTQQISGLEVACRSLRRLYDEGYIRLVSYQDELKNAEKRVKQATELRLTQTDFYRPSILQAVSIWDKIGPELAVYLKRPTDYRATLSVGILNAIQSSGSTISENSIRSIRKVLVKKSRLSGQEAELIKEVARPYVDHVHTSIALHRKLGIPVMDWEDISPIYSSIFAANLEDHNILEKQLPKIRELFYVALTAFEPSNVDEFIKIIRDKRVNRLREFVAAAAEAGENFDAKLVQQLLLRITNINRKSTTGGTVINVVGALTGLLAGSIDGGLTASVINAAGVAGAQEIASRSIGDIIGKDISWFLCLVDAKR